MNWTLILVVILLFAILSFRFAKRRRMTQDSLCTNINKVDNSISRFIIRAQEKGPKQPALANFILINGDITQAKAIEVIREIVWLENESKLKKIIIYLCSIGGNALAGFALHKVMQESEKPIEVWSWKAHSAAALILSSGTKGKRFIYNGSDVMIHSTSFCNPLKKSKKGGVSEIKSYFDKLYIQSISKNTGQPIERVIKNYEKETYFSAYQAVKYGLADSIFHQLPSIFKKKA